MTTTYTLDEMLTLIVIVSFLGFCLENVWLALRKGYIDNRNMYLPFLFGYGLAVSGGYLVFGLPDAEHLERYWITVFIAVSVGEILLGTALLRLYLLGLFKYSAAHYPVYLCTHQFCLCVYHHAVYGEMLHAADAMDLHAAIHHHTLWLQNHIPSDRSRLAEMLA